MRSEDSWRAVEEQPASATATNAVATATKAAKAKQCFYLTGYTISANGAPAAVVQVEIRAGTTAWIRLELPAAAFAPIIVQRRRPLRFPLNTAVNAVLPALGESIRGTIEIEGFYSTD